MPQKTNHSTAVPSPGVQDRASAQLRAALAAQPLASASLSTPALVRAAVRLRGTSLAQLSVRYGYHRDAFTQALRDRRYRSRRIEQILARFLGVAPSDIWPDRYPARARRTAATAKGAA